MLRTGNTICFNSLIFPFASLRSFLSLLCFSSALSLNHGDAICSLKIWLNSSFEPWAYFSYLFVLFQVQELVMGVVNHLVIFSFTSMELVCLDFVFWLGFNTFIFVMKIIYFMHILKTDLSKATHCTAVVCVLPVSLRNSSVSVCISLHEAFV